MWKSFVCPECAHAVSRRSFTTSAFQCRQPLGQAAPKRVERWRKNNAVTETPLWEEDPFSPKSSKRPWQPLSPRRKPVKPDVEKLYHLEVEAFERSPAGLKTLAAIIEEDPDVLLEYGAEWSQRLRGVYVSKSKRAWVDHSLANPPIEEMERAFAQEGKVGLRRIVYRRFLAWASTRTVSPKAVISQRLRLLLERTDFSNPAHWILPTHATTRQRKIIMHVGPTNSGKTHQALVALGKARIGIYAGPLRLLAHEVFSRFNAGTIGELNGVPRPCNLLTGEEQRIVDPNGALTSCTVEMIPTSKTYDVAVIDEIQMIADPQRGSAWTSALLMVDAKEIHLCGEESAVGLLTKMAETCGDVVEVRRYSRLSPLQIAPSINNDLTKIQTGDCIVTFSRSSIFATKQAVEQKTGLKVAVAYGGLPPEVREEQARMFNESKGLDVMVASDAIGMGLNLKIRRMIFSTVEKWDGSDFKTIATPQIKQIAGRAGRFGMHVSPSAPDDIDEAPATPQTIPGEVTTMVPKDLPVLKAAMATPTIHLHQAVINPTDFHLKRLRAVLSRHATFAQVLQVAHFLGVTSKEYFLPWDTHSVACAQLIDQSLPTDEQRSLASAPVPMRDAGAKAAFVHFVQVHAKGIDMDVQDWAQENGLQLVEDMLTKANVAKQASSQTSLQLESFHKALSIYLWLSYRFPLTFMQADAAREMRKKTEQAIDICLASSSKDRNRRRVKAEEMLAELAEIRAADEREAGAMAEEATKATLAAA